MVTNYILLIGAVLAVSWACLASFDAAEQARKAALYDECRAFGQSVKTCKELAQ
jgi:hypothetical protein